MSPRRARQAPLHALRPPFGTRPARGQPVPESAGRQGICRPMNAGEASSGFGLDQAGAGQPTRGIGVPAPTRSVPFRPTATEIRQITDSPSGPSGWTPGTRTELLAGHHEQDRGDGLTSPCLIAVRSRRAILSATFSGPPLAKRPTNLSMPTRILVCCGPGSAGSGPVPKGAATTPTSRSGRSPAVSLQATDPQRSSIWTAAAADARRGVSQPSCHFSFPSPGTSRWRARRSPPRQDRSRSPREPSVWRTRH